jgi:hypothetical protein
MSNPTSVVPAGTGAGYVERQPLGLPAGSVRALLTLMVLGTISIMLLTPEAEPRPIPLYLYYLMFLILGHYFAVRRHAALPGMPQQAPPFYLPRGTFRFLILVGMSAVLAWGFYNDPHFAQRLTPSPSEQPYLLVVVLGAFFVGIVVGRIGHALFAGPLGPPPWFQDIQAWVALLSMVGMTIEIVIRFVINPSVAPERQLTWTELETGVAALVAFYFGVRS